MNVEQKKKERRVETLRVRGEKLPGSDDLGYCLGIAINLAISTNEQQS